MSTFSSIINPTFRQIKSSFQILFVKLLTQFRLGNSSSPRIRFFVLSPMHWRHSYFDFNRPNGEQLLLIEEDGREKRYELLPAK